MAVPEIGIAQRQEDDAMLGDRDAVATIPVKDLDRARRFYGSTLGLESTGDEDPEFASYRTGKSNLMVYRSQYAGTNKATAVTWPVGNEVESIVRTLRAKGVTFEHYELPNSKLEGDVHVTGDHKAAWFKDPDGNIIGIVSS
jgi:catechol 2,3-dioxygenase-like lactoylglutathione lyase family enzyme